MDKTKMPFIIVGNFGAKNEPFYLNASTYFPPRSWNKVQMEWMALKDYPDAALRATRFLEVETAKRWLGTLLNNTSVRCVQVIRVEK